MLAFLLAGGSIILGSYAALVLRRWWAWHNIPRFTSEGSLATTTVSVLIPVRNEARHLGQLLHDLNAQAYPPHLFEILVIDDHSEDETAACVTEFSQTSSLNLQLIQLADYPGKSQKKAALSQGIAFATGELILQTDGDCRVPPQWLSTFAAYYEQTKMQCISGPVCLEPDGSMFSGLQVVEFAALVAIGGASIALESPNMCNGANLAYTRQAFREVHGFAGNEHVASGDDEFLLHKIAARYPGQIAFIKSPEAIVKTQAKETVGELLNQRVRWASKWPHYRQKGIKMLAVVVFAANLVLMLALLGGIFKMVPVKAVVGFYVVKLGADGILLATVLPFFKYRRYIWYMLPLQLIYVPYVVYTALKGLRGTYSWKGRRVN
ncbi:MAG: N-acetylglucosaminyltransferase [uncultured Adhaeribacter sp.]|uniref:N-acetylglucosaminyltransferase n=1 Tax=uncultured Adhaeribacter sp. TaxID=448109 RepID=A0A6J4ICM8_9BACT|nr:MAG: N-acetylglucosaminyltransferase [uncultured Adhaeribacter sp.]